MWLGQPGNETGGLGMWLEQPGNETGSLENEGMAARE